jgi:uncharacterized membrane protein
VSSAAPASVQVCTTTLVPSVDGEAVAKPLPGASIVVPVFTPATVAENWHALTSLLSVTR